MEGRWFDTKAAQKTPLAVRSGEKPDELTIGGGSIRQEGMGARHLQYERMIRVERYGEGIAGATI
jgi:hypothetical protein